MKAKFDDGLDVPAGDRGAKPSQFFLGDLEPLVAVYDGLRHEARRLLARKGRDERSLRPSDLVNEAAVRLLIDSASGRSSPPP